MVQMFQQMPQQENPLGAALGQALGGVGEHLAQQKQMGVLSKALSGEATAEEMATLDPKSQMEVAKLRAVQQKTLAQQNQVYQKSLSDKTKEVINRYKEYKRDLERPYRVGPLGGLQFGTKKGVKEKFEADLKSLNEKQQADLRKVKAGDFEGLNVDSVMTEEVANYYLQQAGNDPVAARKMAMDDGYRE